MQYSSVNRLGDFEFHDAELTLISWEDDRLIVSAKYLNVHKDAAPDHEGTDMEISEAIITFFGFDLKEFEPARTWQRDKHGNAYTNDPLIIHTGAVARSMLRAKLQHTTVVMGIAYVDGIYDLGALGIDPYFSARFTFSDVRIEWDGYRKRRGTVPDSNHQLSFPRRALGGIFAHIPFYILINPVQNTRKRKTKC